MCRVDTSYNMVQSLKHCSDRQNMYNVNDKQPNNGGLANNADTDQSLPCFLNISILQTEHERIYLCRVDSATSTLWTGHFPEEGMSCCFPGPEVINSFSCLTQLSMKLLMLLNLNLLTIANSFLLNIAEHELLSANKYENAKYVGIFIIIRRENFMLS